MHLAELKINNFRIFGNEDNGSSLCIRFDPTLNLIVGENDSGKTALIDAIRILLGTRDDERNYITEDDFHLCKNEEGNIVPTKTLRIEGRFEGLSDDEAGMFLEWLGIEHIETEEDGTRGNYYLRVWIEAKILPSTDLDNRIYVTCKAGPDEEGIYFEGEARKRLRATYLRPLRDVERELAARRGSRLSRILYAKLGPDGDDSVGGDSLKEVVDNANQWITSNDESPIQPTLSELRENYFKKLILAQDNFTQPTINIADADLKRILEQLQLTLEDLDINELNTQHGLGFNNLLFMSAELLLLKTQGNMALPLLLIEEPEAHLHPQLQQRLVQFLKDQQGLQVIMTSHSPNLASKISLNHLIIMKDGQAYPMAPDYTKLEAPDYRFLSRFLDVTKASLFFARGVVLVEGYAEHILLPTIARLLNRSFEERGVTVINVGHRGLFRYARVFQRRQPPEMNINVVCIADLDIPSDAARPYLSEWMAERTYSTFGEDEIEAKREDLKHRFEVTTYCSDMWTLEHDICLYGYAREMHLAISRVRYSTQPDDVINERVRESFAEWKTEGKDTVEIAAQIYKPLYNRCVSKAEVAQQFADILLEADAEPNEYIENLPPYLINAINYVTSFEQEEQND